MSLRPCARAFIAWLRISIFSLRSDLLIWRLLCLQNSVCESEFQEFSPCMERADAPEMIFPVVVFRGNRAFRSEIEMVLSVGFCRLRHFFVVFAFRSGIKARGCSDPVYIGEWKQFPLSSFDHPECLEVPQFLLSRRAPIFHRAECCCIFPHFRSGNRIFLGEDRTNVWHKVRFPLSPLRISGRKLSAVFSGLLSS